jgi:hypothetical protein
MNSQPDASFSCLLFKYLQSPCCGILAFAAGRLRLLLSLVVLVIVSLPQSSVVVGTFLTLKDWSASIVATGGYTGMLNSTSYSQLVNTSTTFLPASTAQGTLNLSFTLATMARIFPPSTFVSIHLGAAGSTASYSFVVQAQDGSRADFNVSLLFIIDSFDWTISVAGAGLNQSTIHFATAAPVTTISIVPAPPILPIALDSSTLTYWISGVSCNTISFSDSQGVLGTIGVSSDANMPMVRLSAASWTGKDGNLYFYGQSS